MEPMIELLKLQREEIALLKFLRELDFGTIEIMVQNGKPVLIKQTTKSIKL